MKQIAIRLDTGPSIGLGHLMRCTSLAEQLTIAGETEVCFICRNRLPWELSYGVRYLKQGPILQAEGYQVLGIEEEAPEMKQVLQERHIDCLIVDHYGAGDTYFEALRECVPYLVCIDDRLKRQIPVDLILNGNIYGTRADYGDVPIQLLGGSYTLLRSEFQNLPEKTIRDQLQNLYITSGGADPFAFCETIVQTVLQYVPDCAIHVIAGPDFREAYMRILQAYPVTIHTNADMLKCMFDADLFITGGGSTLYELATVGTPSISYILAVDQVRVAQEMWSRTCSFRGGWFSEFQPQGLITAIEKLKNPNLRQRISRAGRKAVSSAGAKHAAQKIMELLEREGRP